MSHCKDCKWWDQHGDTDKIGNCHRYPPTVHYNQDEEQQFEVNPETPRAGWCGEFTERRVDCPECGGFAEFDENYPMEILEPTDKLPPKKIVKCHFCKGTGKIDTQP